MTDSFPKYEDRSLEETSSGLTGGDQYYTGDSLVTWQQPDTSDEGGYWESTDLGNPVSRLNQIVARLSAIEAALGINPEVP
jgi:hypothetical protein